MIGGERKEGPGEIALQWWRRHLWVEERDPAQRSYAKGVAARIRRASSSYAVLCEPDVHSLASALGIGPERADKLVQIVRLLAEVRQHIPVPLARTLGGSEPVLSQTRFEKLLRAENEELTNQMRRAIAMADRKCNVASLASDLLFWNDQTRNRWCFDYFNGVRAETPDDLEREPIE